MTQSSDSEMARIPLKTHNYYKIGQTYYVVFCYSKNWFHPLEQFKATCQIESYSALRRIGLEWFSNVIPCGLSKLETCWKTPEQRFPASFRFFFILPETCQISLLNWHCWPVKESGQQCQSSKENRLVESNQSEELVSSVKLVKKTGQQCQIIIGIWSEVSN